MDKLREERSGLKRTIKYLEGSRCAKTDDAKRCTIAKAERRLRDVDEECRVKVNKVKALDSREQESAYARDGH